MEVQREGASVDWVNRGIDWVAAGLKTITDPRWLMNNPGWAALLGLGLVFLVGWFALFRGKRM
jgi:hypothetical protein